MRNRLILLLSVATLFFGCSPTSTDARPPRRPQAIPTTSSGSTPTGLQFKLAPGSPESSAEKSLARPLTTPLSPAEIETLLKRLPPLQVEAGDKKAFAMRERSQPAPKTGNIVPQAFPPPGRPPAPALKAGALKVLRHSPDADVELAPNFSVTFDHPMVPVSSVAEIEAQGVPVQVNPLPKGKWRWLGAKTLLFQPMGTPATQGGSPPEVRFPMATEYNVSIPAGTASANGDKLESAVNWTFKTPTVQVVQSYPNSGPQKLKPYCFVSFNQAIDVTAVFATMHLRAQGHEFPMQLASPEEVALDNQLRALSDATEKSRWLAFAPKEPLPAGTTFTVEIGPGTPSAEGPLKTVSPQAFSFSTYSPLAVEDSSHDPRPGQSWYIRFNNPLDAEKFVPTSLKVTPELPGMRATVSGNILQIYGRSRGRTKYTVSLPSTLPDSFGQSLGKEQPVTIQVVSADPYFAGPNQSFLILDPIGPPQLTCSVLNHKALKVVVYSVTPEDWKSYNTYAQDFRRNPKDLKTPGHEVFNEEVPVKAEPDELVEVKVDLKRALPKGVGQLVVRIEPSEQPKEEWRRQLYIGWVQSTKIGLDAMIDGETVVAWTNRLADGVPMGGVEVEQFPGGNRAASAGDGLARFPVKQGSMLIARFGEDMAILPRGVGYYDESGWIANKTSDGLVWYVMDDRKMYKPGEKVQLKGWVRREIHQHRGDLAMSGVTQMTYKVYDSRGNEILKGETAVGKLGGFHFSLGLPKTVNLGSTRVEMNCSEGSYNHNFEVQEFRRPEFEVKASANQPSCLIGSKAGVTVTANYYAGGALPNAEVQWSATASQTSFSPPKWPEFSFGGWTPWWGGEMWWRGGYSEPSNSQSLQTRTDSSGKSILGLEFVSVHPARPSTVSVQATVQDVNRQAWSSSTSLLVHPASVYVGLKPARSFVEQGQPIDMSTIVADLDGQAVAGRTIQVTAYRSDWEWKGGQMQIVRADVVSQTLTSAASPVNFTIPTKAGGTYQIEALVMDDNNRRNQSEMTVWVAGGKQPPKRSVEQETVTLIPSQKEYKSGEVAEVLVQTPFAPAEIVVSKRRHGLVETARMTLATGSTTLKIPIEDGFMPNLNVQVDAVGSSVRSDDDGKPLIGLASRPAYAVGSLNLSIPPKDRKLTVEIEPAVKALEPGGKTEISLLLRDAAGKPVVGEVAVMMVDESILALTGYDPADPMGVFYRYRDAGVSDVHSRQFIELALPQELAEQKQTLRGQEEGFGLDSSNAPAASAAPKGAIGGGMKLKKADTGRQREEAKSKVNSSLDDRESSKESDGVSSEAIRVRTDFNPLALFAPAVQTDAGGRARLPVKLPDNLTRYRLIAIAVAGEKQFGKGESSLTARQPLMVRPSAPRFLNFGDKFELPVVLQNQTDKPMDVDVVCRGSNAKIAQRGFKLKVPANDRVEVRFPASTEKAGTARFQVGASSGRTADAAEVSLPVWTPATSEAFATYGTLDDGALAQPVQAPGKVFPQFGGLEITTTSTALAELTDAYIYLQSYPYECSEQLSSRVLAAAALKDVLSAFKAPGLPSKEAMQTAMKRDLDRLKALQNYDGGWDYWIRGEPSVPYPSLHVAHALVRAKSKGFAVDEQALQQALQFASTIEQHIPSEYPEVCKWSLRAYALYVLRLADKPDVAKAKALLQEATLAKLPLEAVGWILPTLSKHPVAGEIRRLLANKVSETASTAQFSTSYGDGAYLMLYSDRRDDAVLLEALIEDQPKNDVIPKLARGLLDHRTRGRWENTQENCFVLLALDRYFHAYESVTPDFLAQVWLGPDYAGEQPFRGRSADQKLIQIPMAQLKGRQDLVLQKTGKGRLYYRIGMTYAPEDLKLEAADYGFTVERKYEAVKDNRDVRRDADGSWHIKSGSEVRVTVTMVAPQRRYHVALVDPLPAGLETLNPALAVTGSHPARTRNNWWQAWWYDHENLRDERTEAFTSLLWEGVYSYSYLARATTPGNFVVPPAKAEEMYHPETFGRSHSDRVMVE